MTAASLTDMTTTPIRGGNGAQRQESALALEGVQVERSSLGERIVDFDLYGWFPDQLPSEARGDEESS
jgi:methylated-DNA-protein-cysteine methyltransferase-like protein